MGFCTRDKPTIKFRAIDRGYLLKERTADPRGTGPRYSLLNDEIRARSKKNLVESRLFSEMLEEAIRQPPARHL
ncbi:MAG TPA: type I restriction enzyme endonuclease domain-containing protein [Terriglobia bacterium]|nr:type I restriction enzyme endonuclease domain-containing protein [Terriglobia bacterium]